jgi:hypothetical protein
VGIGGPGPISGEGNVGPSDVGPIGTFGLGPVGAFGPGLYEARPVGPVPVTGAIGPNVPLGAGALLGHSRPFGPGPILPGPGPILPGPGSILPGPGLGHSAPIGGQYGHPPIYQDGPAAYEFSYGVQTDDYHGSADFGHNEQRDGYTTVGQYHVNLPGHSSQSHSYTVGPAHGPAYGQGPIL